MLQKYTLPHWINSPCYSKAAMLERQRLRQAGQLNAPLGRCSRVQWMRNLTAKVNQQKEHHVIRQTPQSSSQPPPR